MRSIPTVRGTLVLNSSWKTPVDVRDVATGPTVQPSRGGTGQWGVTSDGTAGKPGAHTLRPRWMLEDIHRGQMR
ncbi:hypothetical protein DVH02_31545 [Streptomyces corynorhini]|uniref:Uncharacterized protein n=1 Tax=Streptomyces corynorhini TaxID=2282652 RepID=A0A370AZP5_9ACTN|nr:hypothetical protein DVH02_31545 [Streptomyces corynorhini]